jgi:hypothetical protein
VIRRLALAVGLSVLVLLGFGAAYGLSSVMNADALAGATKKPTTGASNGHTPVTICHKPGTPAEKTLTVDDDAVSAHLGHGDHVGPCGGPPVTETTVEMPTTTLVGLTPTVVPNAVTEPAETMTTEVTVTTPVPPETTTVPPSVTLVTVPPGTTTTVTVPGQTVTEPAVTTTLPGVPGVTIERPPETVTLPETTTTITATGTTSVVTVTGPNQIVHPGLVIKQKVQAKVERARRIVRFAARVHRLRVRLRFLTRTVLVVVHQTTAGIARGAGGCPPGTAPFNGTCKAVVRGKG